jgi:peptidoglycan/xylan/chitin deacetylase (PgdA/CDA1 family)
MAKFLKNRLYLKIISAVLTVIIVTATLYYIPFTRKGFMNTYTEAKELIYPNVPVLLYHNIVDPNVDDPFRYSFTSLPANEFEKQMKLLYDNGFTTITTDDLYRFLQGGTIPEKSVLITFDDGYESNFSLAYPILKKYGFKATIFLQTDMIASKQTIRNDSIPKYLEADKMPEMTDVFEYGSHCHRLHYPISPSIRSFVSAPYDVMVNDLLESKKYINTKSFAYPFGKYNDTAVSAVKAAGFKMAFSTIPDQVNRNSDIFLLPRLVVSRTASNNEFCTMVGIY